MKERAMGKLKVALVGAGFIARVHAASWKRIPGAEITAIVDIVEEKARELAGMHGVKHVYTDYREMLRREQPDIVDVCTPTYTHARIAIDSLEAGANVITEKPIATRLADARAMIDAARRSGGKFMVAHCLRYWPEYVAIKRVVERGEIGEPRVARAYRQSGFPVWAEWHFDINKGGGVFVDMSIHDVDALRWIVGDVEEVFARGGVLKEKRSTAPDYIHALFKFRGGAIGFVEGSWAQPPGYPFSTYMEIAGTEGTLRVDSKETASVKVWTGGPPTYMNPNSRDAYYLELLDFYRAVVEDREPGVPGEEGLKSLEAVLAATKSALEGEPVRLPLREEVLEEVEW